MAIIKRGFLTGSSGNTVFRIYRGGQIAQSFPRGVRQTKATKGAAHLFGRASILSSTLKQMFSYIIYGFHDGTFFNRLTRQLRDILEHNYDPLAGKFSFELHSFDRLAGFDFNENSPLYKSLRASIDSSYAEGKINISLREISIPKELRFPDSTSTCSINFLLVMINLDQGKVWERQAYHRIKVNKSQILLEEQAFQFDAPDGCICLVGVTIQYKGEKFGEMVPYNSKAFSPGGICAAFFTPGRFNPEDSRQWRSISNWKPMPRTL